MLEMFGSKSLGDLELEANGNLVVLGDTHVNENGRRDKPFFVFKGNKEENCFWLETRNLMGVLHFRDKSGASVQVEVLSRFDKGKNNFFLNYLLSKVFRCALGAEPVSAQRASLLDILLDIVFVRRLGEASKAGLLRHYREFRNNDWNFKGSLDLARHIRENVPLMHGIAYRKREIDLDVPVNRMILMAALTVNRRHPEFFEGERDASDALRQLRMGVTEERDLRMLLSRRDCREPVTHPFFREVWEPLRQIARMILENEQWTLFSQDATEDEVSGIVFDGSWLWEEYVAKVLEQAGFEHRAERFLKIVEWGVARFKPDFYRDDKQYPSKRIVLDAKYKRSNPNGERHDVHQVLCYLLLTGAKQGGLVFPPVDDKCETKDDASDCYGATKAGGWYACHIADSTENYKEPIHWSCFSWEPIPKGSEDSPVKWPDFCRYMEGQETQLMRLQKCEYGCRRKRR